MGMFDWITNVPEEHSRCRECGAELTSWQSKDGACVLGDLPYWTVNNFYTYCDRCGTWHEYTRKERQLEIEDYDLEVTPRAVKPDFPAPPDGTS